MNIKSFRQKFTSTVDKKMRKDISLFMVPGELIMALGIQINPDLFVWVGIIPIWIGMFKITTSLTLKAIGKPNSFLQIIAFISTWIGMGYFAGFIFLLFLLPLTSLAAIFIP